MHKIGFGLIWSEHSYLVGAMFCQGTGIPPPLTWFLHDLTWAFTKVHKTLLDKFHVEIRLLNDNKTLWG